MRDRTESITTKVSTAYMVDTIALSIRFNISLLVLMCRSGILDHSSKFKLHIQWPVFESDSFLVVTTEAEISSTSFRHYDGQTNNSIHPRN